MLMIVFEGCGDPYIENDLGSGYYLFADPYEILFSKNDNHYEFVIEPHVVSYVYDSNYILAKTKNSKYNPTIYKFWLVDKKDTISHSIDSVIFTPDNRSYVRSVKGSVRGPYDSLTFVSVLDSLNIQLEMSNVKVCQ